MSLSEEESLALLSLLDDGSLDASEMDVETLRVEADSDSDNAGDGNFSDDDNDVPGISGFYFDNFVHSSFRTFFQGMLQ